MEFNQSIYCCLLLFSHFSSVQLFCSPMDCSLQGFSVHGILKGRILGCVAISFSRVSTQESNMHLLHWQADSLPLRATREVHLSLWKWKWSHSVVSDSLWPHGLWPTRLLPPWEFPAKSTGVECQCNPYQITNDIFHRTRTKYFTIHMETQKTPNSQSSVEKEEWTWRSQASWLQIILQSYSHQDSMVLA